MISLSSIMIIDNYTNILKIMSCIVLLAVSLIMNYFHFWKVDKKFYYVILVSSFVFYIILFFLDSFLFKNDFIDFFASNMLLSFLLSITFEDIKTNLIDTRVVVGYFILFLIYRIIFLDLTIFLEGFIGFALSLIIMLIAYFIKKNSIGIGDVETIAACGMIIGFPNIFHFLFKTFLFVFIVGIFIMITKKQKLIKELPLAPFLLIATIL